MIKHLQKLCSWLLLFVMLCLAAPGTAEGDAPSDSVAAITAAYLTCDHSTLRVGEEAVWTLHIEGAPAEAFNIDYALGYQPPTATDANFFMHGNRYGSTELTCAFTPDEHGRYVLWALISDQYGSSLEAQSTFYITVDESSPEGIALMQKVDEIVGLCRASGAKSEYDIALFMHDYLITHADYDETYTYYFPEGVLLYGTGVCQSYATAYQLLLEAMGMECLMVVGYAGEDHSWNLVRIDGEWFHVDCTFDDPVGMGIENHQYFMLSDEMIALDHTWDEALYPSAVGIPDVGTPIVLTADGQPAGEYATVAAAFEAAAGLTCTELDVCITTGRTLLLPAGDWPACAERITIRGNPSTALLYMQGNVTLHSDLQLDNAILSHSDGLTFDMGGHRLAMSGVQFGVLNLDDTNMDKGLAQQLYLTGGTGSELAVTDTKSELYCHLSVDTLTIDNSRLNLRGGSVTVNIGTLKAVNGSLEVGVNESSDSVDTTISRVCIEDGSHLFFLPTPGSKLTIHTIAPTTGQLGFHTAKLAGMLNQSEDFTEMDITIWSEYIPENFQLMDYQYTTFSNSTNADAYREYIPYGARLMRIPYLDPAAAEVTLNLKVLDADDRATEIAYEHLSFSVELDGEGYAVRGNDRTQSWIGDYYVLHQPDNVGTPIVLTADGQPAGEYATIAAAFEAAAGLTCTELDVCITTGRTLLLPAGDWPACAERITIRGKTGTAILFLQGDTVLHSALRLDNVILLHSAGVLFDIGNHRLAMSGVKFGVLILDDTNMDKGLAQQLYLTGGTGSELAVTDTKSELYCHLSVDTLTIDNSRLLLRGGSVTANIGTLKAVNGSLEVGDNESADSVDTTISRVCIEDGSRLWFYPTPGSKLTIHTIAPTTGQLGFVTAKLAGMLNQSEDFTEMDITIWSEYIPEDFQLMDYQYTTFSNSTNVDAYREYIPYGARLMRIPYLDPASAEVTLNLSVLDADDRATEIAHDYLRFSVELDGEGYAVRGNDSTRSWVGNYYMLHKPDNACTIINPQTGLHNVMLPSELNGRRVTGIGSLQPYLYDQQNAWQSCTGSIVIPKGYESIIGWKQGFKLTCAVFLGEKPVFDAATVRWRGMLPVFYLTRHAASWQEERGLPMYPSQLHAIDADHMLIVSADSTAVTADAFSGVHAATILISPGCLTIEDGAFADSGAGTVFLPSTLTFIADNTFAGCTDAVFFVDQDDCYAAQWAKRHRYTVYTVDLYTALVYGLCDHVWDEGVLSSVNCAENRMTYTCTVCGMTKAVAIPTYVPHEWQESGTLLRCTASQYIYRCIHCGEEWYVDMAELLPWPCTWNQRLILIQQTCTEPGEALYQCAYCTNEQRVPIPPHFWSEGTLTVLSDDGAAGEMHYVCRDCGETKTVAVIAGLPGDINDDGQADALDVVDLREWCNTGMGEINLLNGDLNNDGIVDMQDVLVLTELCSAF